MSAQYGQQSPLHCGKPTATLTLATLIVYAESQCGLKQASMLQLSVLNCSGYLSHGGFQERTLSVHEHTAT